MLEYKSLPISSSSSSWLDESMNKLSAEGWNFVSMNNRFVVMSREKSDSEIANRFISDIEINDMNPTDVFGKVSFVDLRKDPSDYNNAVLTFCQDIETGKDIIKFWDDFAYAQANQIRLSTDDFCRSMLVYGEKCISRYSKIGNQLTRGVPLMDIELVVIACVREYLYKMFKLSI